MISVRVRVGRVAAGAGTSAPKKKSKQKTTNSTSSLAATSPNAAGAQAFHWHDAWKENLNVYSLIIPFFYPERECVCVWGVWGGTTEGTQGRVQGLDNR